MTALAGAEATWGRLDKQALEACLDVVALSLSVVMAGTGHLPTLKLLRGSSISFTTCRTSSLAECVPQELAGGCPYDSRLERQMEACR